MGNGRAAAELADQLRANVSYAVLLGVVLTALLGIAAMFGDTSRPLPVLPDHGCDLLWITDAANYLHGPQADPRDLPGLR